jgi:ribosome maturation protein SDO1
MSTKGEKKVAAPKAEKKAAAPKVVKRQPKTGAKNQPIRLYAKAAFTGFRRNLRSHHPNHAIARIEGVNTAEDAKFYLGKRVAYIYRAEKEKDGHKFRVIWGRVVRANFFRMSKVIRAPKTQKRLTNIVVVRLQIKGNRFELACYPNKVEEWRKKLETDLDEVLQTPHIYTNVSQGQIANENLLEKGFDTTDKHEICLKILEKGEIQISGEERKKTLDQMFKDIAQIIVEKCINAETQEALTINAVEKAMKECHVSVDINKSAKQQALIVIKTLIDQSKLPIERAKMRIKAILPNKQDSSFEEKINQFKKLMSKIESEVVEDSSLILIFLIEPSHYREIEQFCKTEGGKNEVVTHCVKSDVVSHF